MDEYSIAATWRCNCTSIFSKRVLYMKVKLKTDTEKIAVKPQPRPLNWLSIVAVILSVIALSSTVYFNKEKIKESYVNMQE
jgi:hypothetical protein